jgi:hypothetical protein
MQATELPLPENVIADLAEAIWAKMIGSNCDPVELNLRAKLALESRLLGGNNVPFGLDKPKTETEVMMDPENKHPPLLQRGRVQNDTGITNTRTDNQTLGRKQETTIVETIIGRAFIVIRTERYFYYPDVIAFGWWPYKTGTRKGLSRRVRIHGERGESRVTIRRFRDPTEVARAYHALRQSLDMPRCGIRDRNGSLVMMGAAFLTHRGAGSAEGQTFGTQLRRMGVLVAGDPMTERMSRAYWFADCVADGDRG